MKQSWFGSSSGAPMLQRVRETIARGGARIPRRGRIRAALVALLVVAAAIVASRKRSDRTEHDPAPSGESARSTAAAERPRAGTASLPRDVFSTDDVALLLRDRAPRLRVPSDTLRLSGRSLVVDYSVDTAIQHHAEILLDRYHPKYGAVLAMNPTTGRVLAAASYTNAEEDARGSQLYLRNYFPAASIFKIVTAAGAIEKGGFHRESMVRRVGRNHTLYKFQLEKEPKQFDEIPFADAFAYSVNSTFGRLGIYVLAKSGLASYSERFGFMQPIPFELQADTARISVGDSAYALAELASGFNQETRMSPLFGALMASAVSEGGAIPTPWLVDSVVELPGGKRLYVPQRRPWRIAMRPQTAEELKQMMMGVTRYGTARRSFKIVRQSSMFKEMEYGGKTGNVDRDDLGRVDWFVGFARHPEDVQKRIAIGVVTVHGPYWTVHSSYVAAALFRRYLRILREERTRAEKAKAKAEGGKEEG